MAEMTTLKEKAPVATPKAEPKAKKTSKKSDTFAILATGGKQYIVTPGQNLKIEKILGEHKEGDVISFKEVMLKSEGDKVTFGAPFISGGSISATIIKIGRYKTVDVVKYKQKSRYFKKNGHRQPYFEVRIDSIK